MYKTNENFEHINLMVITGQHKRGKCMAKKVNPSEIIRLTIEETVIVHTKEGAKVLLESGDVIYAREGKACSTKKDEKKPVEKKTKKRVSEEAEEEKKSEDDFDFQFADEADADSEEEKDKEDKDEDSEDEDSDEKSEDEDESEKSEDEDEDVDDLDTEEDKKKEESFTKINRLRTLLK